MKRILAEDLKPGDVFEYEYGRWRYDEVRGELRWTVTMRRDDVLSRCNQPRGRSPVEVRGWNISDDVDSGYIDDAVVVSTLVGSNNHGYVAFRPQTVVLLIHRAEPIPTSSKNSTVSTVAVTDLTYSDVFEFVHLVQGERKLIRTRVWAEDKAVRYGTNAVVMPNFRGRNVTRVLVDQGLSSSTHIDFPDNMQVIVRRWD